MTEIVDDLLRLSRDDRAGIRGAKKKFVSFFRAHWVEVVNRLQRGEDVAGEREDCFFAAKPQQRRILSTRFYALEHARHIAKRTDDQIVEACAPWLDDLLRSAVAFYSGRKRSKFLLGSVRAEYITAIRAKQAKEWAADGYPMFDVAYDDFYERTASGFSVGAHVKVFKSTGESYRRSERRWAEQGIKMDFRRGQVEDAATDEQWNLSFSDTCGPVCIEVHVNKDEHLLELAEGIEKMGRPVGRIMRALADPWLRARAPRD